MPIGAFDPSQDYAWPILSASGGIVGFNPAEIAIDASGFANSLNGGYFSVAQSGNSLELVYTVPEPASIALLAAAAIALVGYGLGQRRQKRLAVR